jgi:hypothetical protein
MLQSVTSAPVVRFRLQTAPLRFNFGAGILMVPPQSAAMDNGHREIDKIGTKLIFFTSKSWSGCHSNISISVKVVLFTMYPRSVSVKKTRKHAQTFSANKFSNEYPSKFELLCVYVNSSYSAYRAVL